MSRSFLQTEEWLKFQESVGHKVWRFSDGKIRANIIKFKLPFGKSYLYIPHGPEIDLVDVKGGIKNELNNFLTHLRDLAVNQKAIFVKFEPLSDVVMELLYRKGIRRSSKQVQPFKTVILDLNMPEEHLLGKMHPKTRYNIKVAQKNNIEIKKSTDADAFWKLMQKTTARDKFSSHSKEYYENMLDYFANNPEIKTELFLAYHDNKPVAGAIVMRYGDTGYYLHGASDYEHRALMAPYLLHWEVIKQLRFEGFKFYDLWGVDVQKWPGVTRFKLGWGGVQREYPGSFDFIVSKFWYWSYTLARKVF